MLYLSINGSIFLPQKKTIIAKLCKEVLRLPFYFPKVLKLVCVLLFITEMPRHQTDALDYSYSWGPFLYFWHLLGKCYVCLSNSQCIQGSLFLQVVWLVVFSVLHQHGKCMGQMLTKTVTSTVIFSQYVRSKIKLSSTGYSAQVN